MNLFIALVIGLMAGAHSATWGMYKDAIYEGFTYRKYFRSIIFSGLIAVVFERVANLDVTWTANMVVLERVMHLDLARPANMVVLYGMTYVIERGVLEFYKTFLREEDQSKYFIPMQFHVGGTVVQSQWRRWLAGVAYLVGVALAIASIIALQNANLKLPNVVVVLLIGSVGGWISAFGGAWKDAPLEGFEWLKFFRSPIVASLYALLIACFTDTYLYISMGGLGYTVGTIETYKTFFFPNKPRGKFAGKTIQYPEMLEKRNKFVPLYVAIWVAVITTCVIAFVQPRTGLI
jgi:uncharacterized membrane protein